MSLIERLDSLHEKATAAPWEPWFSEWGPEGDEHSNASAFGPTHSFDDETDEVDSDDEYNHLGKAKRDAELISALRNSWPSLSAAIRAGEEWLKAEDNARDKTKYPLTTVDYPMIARELREAFRTALAALREGGKG